MNQTEQMRKHILDLYNAVSKACADKESVVKATIKSQGGDYKAIMQALAATPEPAPEQMLREALQECQELLEALPAIVPTNIELVVQAIETRQKVEQALAAEPAPTVEGKSQNWSGMDGATAWQLIQRHADGWEEIGKMMHEWLAANKGEPAPEDLLNGLTQQETEQTASCLGLLRKTAPLVRLTEEEWKAIADTHGWGDQDIGIYPSTMIKEIMDAMIAKNGGKV